MLIRNLQLLNFRNYSSLDISFNQQPTVFIGPNGAGKSNILEAIYLLSTSKSPRADQEIEFIQNNQDVGYIKGHIQEDDEETELAVHFIKNGDVDTIKKRVFINGLSKRVIDFVGNLPAVIFWPSDINMVTGSPSLRRWHIDIAIAQSSRVYKRALTLYEQVLTNRNRILKKIREGEAKRDELTYWTEELIRYALVIQNHRMDFFAFINTHPNLLGAYEFQYKQNQLTVERLEQYQEREIAAVSTLIGPHRDDFVFGIRNPELEIRNLSKYGSRGEQRMGTLAFKLAQLEYMSHILGKRPILLLDDVFSELDLEHRAAITHIATLQQTLITTVESENISADFLQQSKVIQVKDGKIDVQE